MKKQEITIKKKKKGKKYKKNVTKNIENFIKI